MLKQEERKMNKKHECGSCGEERSDCKIDPLSQEWICLTCQTGEMPVDQKCKDNVHEYCKAEVCYCPCHGHVKPKDPGVL